MRKLTPHSSQTPEQTVASPKRHGQRRTLSRGFPALSATALLLITWQIAVQLSGVRPTLLPSPTRVAQQAWNAREALLSNTLATLHVTLLGIACSIAISALLAGAMAQLPLLRRALTPLLVASQTLPLVAIAPLFVLWFGFGLTPKLLIVILVTFFVFTIGIVEGLEATPAHALDLFRALGATPSQTFWKLRLPYALPRLFTALRLGMTYAVVGAIFAEYAGARAGLGIFMSAQKNSFRTDLVLAAVGITAALSIGGFALVSLLQRTLAPWSLPDTHHRAQPRNRTTASTSESHPAGGAGRTPQPAAVPAQAAQVAATAAAQAAHATPAATETPKPALTATGLTITRGTQSILTGITFTLHRGETIAIVGSSGVGKSTLLAALSGVTPATTGTVTFPEHHATPATRTTALMPQHDSLLPWRNALRNATLSLELAGVPRRHAATRAAALFAAFGLDGSETKYPAALSGGMRQRVALLRTILSEPAVLLLDEPFGALDPIRRSELHEWMLRQQTSHTLSTVLVTHDLAEAAVLADRVLVLGGGAPATITHDLPGARHAPERVAEVTATIARALATGSRVPLDVHEPVAQLN